MDKVFIQNISSSMVTIVAPDARFRRELIPNRTIEINHEIYEELMFDPGMQNLIKAGFLRITGENIEEAKTIVEDAGVNSLDETSVKKMFDSKDITAFAKLIPNASPATKETIVKVAVENNMVDRPFVALIDKYCGIDLIEAISKQRQAEA